jgi:hypothetical protein
VSKGTEAVWGVARPQGVEGSGMAGPHETLESPWIPLPVRAWVQVILLGVLSHPLPYAHDWTHVFAASFSIPSDAS